tara:strand:- start:1305 stop:2876 length:1572 start_codon:yes stop_codon:yes gene_type:complete
MFFKGDLLDILQFNILTIFKSGNVFFDTAIGYLLYTLVSYCINIDFEEILNCIKPYIYCDSYNEIVLQGKQMDFLSKFSESARCSGIYSDNFQAVFKYIIDNTFDTNKVHYIREMVNTNGIPGWYNDDNINNIKYFKEMFIVNNPKSFLISNDIYCSVESQNEQRNSDDKEQVKMEKITIRLYSYRLKMKQLYDFVNKLKKKYLDSVREKRSYNKYIYTLEKIEYNNNISECWNDCIFQSNRTFNNLFFENKNEILKQINFFINNENWYNRMGIPYNLGICLYGTPGTGKTSFVKALANYTNRNIIVLSLKLIKTKQQLDTFFHEKMYTEQNKTICDFKDKIILLEDIDCATNIVYQRKSFGTETQYNNETNEMLNNRENIINILNEDIDKNIINNCDMNDKNKSLLKSLSTTKNDNKLTLDDILNLIDGVKETSGRIMIITTNHYNKLDRAFVRPGRIDITMEMKKANVEIVCNMFKMFFNKNVPNIQVKKIKKYKYTPAEIVNIYLNCNKQQDIFLTELCK